MDSVALLLEVLFVDSLEAISLGFAGAHPHSVLLAIFVLDSIAFFLDVIFVDFLVLFLLDLLALVSIPTAWCFPS